MTGKYEQNPEQPKVAETDETVSAEELRALNIRPEVLVMGGVHGNEPFGIALVESLRENPIPGVDAVIANEWAARQKTRFIDSELSGGSDPSGSGYEDKRLGELITIGDPYALVLDFHNAADPEVSEVWVQDTPERLHKPTKWLLNEAAIKFVINADGASKLYNALPQIVSIERGTPPEDYEEWEQQEVARWRDIIERMANTGLDNLTLPPGFRDNLTFLVLTRSITREEAKRHDVEKFSDLKRYDRLPTEMMEALELPPGTYRVAASGYRNMSKPVEGTDEREYWGSIVREIPPLF